MATWQLQSAKAQLSEVIERAQTQGPQFITRHGTERAVILSTSEYARLNGGGKSLIEHLLSCPKVDGFAEEVESLRRSDRNGNRYFEFDEE